MRGSGPGTITALWLIVAMQIRALLRRKRLIFLTLVLLLPPFVSFMMKVESGNALESWVIFAPQAYLVFLVPILSIFHGASAIADEVDDRTLGYLLMRPISRDVIAFGKVVGATLVTAALACFSFSLSHQLIYWRGSIGPVFSGDLLAQYLRVCGIICWGSLIYVSFSALLSLLIRWPTMAAILYLALVEIGCAYVPGPLAGAAMSTRLMRLLPPGLRSVEDVIGAEVFREAPPREPVIAAGVLLVVTGLLTIWLLRRFRSHDLSGTAEGDQ